MVTNKPNSPDSAVENHHNNPMTLKAATTSSDPQRVKPMTMRNRADSTNSTRGAFEPLVVSPAQQHHDKNGTTTASSPPMRRRRRVPTATPSPEKLIGAEMDLSDIASLAMIQQQHQDDDEKTPSPIRPLRQPDLLADHPSSSQTNLHVESTDSADSPMPFFEQIKSKTMREDSLQYSNTQMDSLLMGMKFSVGSRDQSELTSDVILTSSGVSQTSLREGVSSLFGTKFLENSMKDVTAAPLKMESMLGSTQEEEAEHSQRELTLPSYGSTETSSSSLQREPLYSTAAAASGSSRRQQEIAMFSSLVQGSVAYDDSTPRQVTPPQPPQQQQATRGGGVAMMEESFIHDDVPAPFDLSFQKSLASVQVVEDHEDQEPKTWREWLAYKLNPSSYLAANVVLEDDGGAHYEEPTSLFPRLLRQLLYTPEVPEFTSLQQFCWAIILGIAMGVYTALWKNLIEYCVEVMWKTVPEKLYDWGFFTDLNGFFPLPHYVWICPSIFGGVLSYVFCILPKPIPGQNEWIKSLHSRGVQDHETFWTLFFLSTAGMASGLSLGPELPLVLTAGMIGSYLGVATRQSILSARAMNLTAASAAVAGFFGFPMAGALFVLEIPHRMGLQYFEALSPATIASIVAVIVNRMILNNDVTGYYNYPFLTTTLPSHIFYIAIVYGLVGGLLGMFYCDAVLLLKKAVHDWFSTPHHGSHDDAGHGEEEEDATLSDSSMDAVENGKAVPLESEGESSPLLRAESSRTVKIANRVRVDLVESVRIKAKSAMRGIAHEPTRAAAAGTLAGFLTGVTCMFVPHALFWGEAQLQTLIDKGRTPLPVFGREGEPTADLTAWGYCLIDPNDADAIEAGFNVGCAALISFTKILVVGLSLGTGIIGGHFWGPLFVGCAASHLFTDLMEMITGWTGFGANLSAYPCVAILCIMGSSHVVTFRAHMAIMLILTLTISAFYPDGTGGPTAGDYSAVFPLLVVSCFVSLMMTREKVFYKEQRSRGDIMAAPEVLCEPGKEGTTFVVDYNDDDVTQVGEEEEYNERDTPEDDDDDIYVPQMTQDSVKEESSYVSYSSDEDVSDVSSPVMDGGLTQQDIEDNFAALQNADRGMNPPAARRSTVTGNAILGQSNRALLHDDDHLNEILSKPLPPRRHKSNADRHRRVQSTNDIDPTLNVNFRKNQGTTPGHSRSGSITGSTGRRSRSNSISSRKSESDDRLLMAVSSFGELKDFHPSLFDHARQRAASINRPPRSMKGRHSRQNSQTSQQSEVATSAAAVAGSLSLDDLERSFVHSNKVAQ